MCLINTIQWVNYISELCLFSQYNLTFESFIGLQDQNYQMYGQGGNQPPAQNQQNYDAMQGYRQDGANQQYPSQMNMGQPQDRPLNSSSHHEASAALSAGYVNQQNYGGQRTDLQFQQDRNSGYTAQQQYRGDSGMQNAYAQPGGQNMPSQPHLGGMGAGMPSAGDSNVISGFLGQTPVQSAPTMPSQMMNQTPDMSRGMIDGQGFQFNPDLSGQGANPGVTPTGSAQPMNMPLGQNTDPQSMDIGALNRMAEYYATHSDYPKVSI
jgi:hypothetical protein